MAFTRITGARLKLLTRKGTAPTTRSSKIRRNDTAL
jgi:hypothetical protein